MQDLKVAIVQSSLVWEDVSANLNKFTNILNKLSKDVDLVVLPEMFNTGFTMNTSLVAESMDGKTVQWVIKIAKQHDVVIIGSLIIEENNSFYNRCCCVYPSGEVKTYDKRHLFRMAKEHHYFSPGTQNTVVEIKGWKVCLQVCYDLRFPVWSRNISGYDVLIYVANWPERRVAQWERLLQARAIENQCYVLAANRVGVDGKEISYSGSSGIIDFQGEWKSQLIHEESIIYETLDYKALEQWREQFPVFKDADSFQIS